MDELEEKYLSGHILPPHPPYHIGASSIKGEHYAIYKKQCTRCGEIFYTTDYGQRKHDVCPPVKCSQCGKEFSPKRSDARFCSNACRQKAYRRRTMTAGFFSVDTTPPEGR